MISVGIENSLMRQSLVGLLLILAGTVVLLWLIRVMTYP